MAKLGVSIPEDLYQDVLKELGVRSARELPYGTLSRLITALLARWLAERRASRAAEALFNFRRKEEG